MNEKEYYPTLKRGAEETEEAYIYRLCQSKGTEGLENWTSVCSKLNEGLGYHFDESTYRKKYGKLKEFFNQEVSRRFDANNPEAQEAFQRQQDDLFKLKVRARDALREKRAELRFEGRLDELKEHIMAAAREVPTYPILRDGDVKVDGIGEAVLAICDWHIGAYTNTYWNKFDLGVAKERVARLGEEVVIYCKRMGIRRLHIINLQDMVEGNIHVTTRVQNELNVVDSTMRAGELIVGLLTYIERFVEKVSYGETLSDNHGRVTSNYKEHIEAENFVKFISWWMRERLARLGSTIILEDNYYDDGIGVVQLENGKRGFYVHGHFDKPGTVAANLTALLDEIPDFIFMGHFHSSMAKDTNFGQLYIGGSLKGMDDYGVRKRYKRKPSQKMVVFEKNAQIDINIEL